MAMLGEELVTVAIPAAYLEDVRSALVAEIDSDGGMLRTNQASFLERSDEVARIDRDGSVEILSRDLQMLSGLINATTETELVADAGGIRMVLEELAQQLHGRLGDLCQYGPLPLRDVLDVATELAWAAQEAMRVLPDGDDRLTAKDHEVATVTLSRLQRDGLRDFLVGHINDDLSYVERNEEWDSFRDVASRLNDCIPILDELGWETRGARPEYQVVVTGTLRKIVAEIRPHIVGTIADDERGLNEPVDPEAASFAHAQDRAALEAADLISEAVA